MKNYMFGYGSLVSEESRKRTGITGKSFLVKLYGYKRNWNTIIKGDYNAISLGLEKSSGNVCNGVLFEIDENELEKFDERETNSYKRIEISLENFEFLGDEKITEGKVWMYIVQDNEGSLENYPIYQSYVDVVLNAALSIGKKFAEEFVKTTFGWKKIVNDREKPKYPRALINLDKKEEIDKLIESIK